MSLSRLPKTNKILIAVVATVMAGITVFSAPETESSVGTKVQYQLGQHYPLDISEIAILETNKQPDTNNELVWKNHVVKSGESLAVAFNKVGLDAATLHKLVNSDKNTKTLVDLHPGDNLEFGFDPSGNFVELRQPRSALETLVIRRIGDGFKSNIDTKVIDTHTNFAKATIESSFWNAADNAGLTPNQIMEVAALFGWDIDFALDIRRGDKFEVLFEQLYIDGQPVDRGNILAATFTNMGETFTAVRSKDGQYYDKNGQAMRKAFLRSPINFRYVSSNFNPRRLHPVTKQVKAHNGTDYVAPVGTPIWSAGDGVVSASGYNKFNGNYVFIRHSSKYMTKYLHMTKRMVKTGQRVKQGQTIGTLGGTGRVTGPHLHYEFLVNGVHKNPRTVDLPQATSLSGKKKLEFKQQASNQLNQLNKLSQLVNPNEMLLNQS